MTKDQNLLFLNKTVKIKLQKLVFLWYWTLSALSPLLRLCNGRQHYVILLVCSSESEDSWWGNAPFKQSHVDVFMSTSLDNSVWMASQTANQVAAFSSRSRGLTNNSASFLYPRSHWTDGSIIHQSQPYIWKRHRGFFCVTFLLWRRRWLILRMLYFDIRQRGPITVTVCGGWNM